LYLSSFGQAVGALHAVAELGRRVPDDLSLLAFEDVPSSAYTVPPLSTIAMPMRQLGEKAVDVLLDLIGGAPPATHELPTEPRVIVRASTSTVAAA
jgi:LacI family transcriptional regulator